MRKVITAAAALTCLGVLPALAASSSTGTSRGVTNGARINPGMRTGPAAGSDVGMAPNAGPGAFRNNRAPYTPTAPPVPGSAQDPYGNSATGSGAGTSGAGTIPGR